MPVIEDIKVSFEAGEAEKIPGLRCRGLMHKRILSMLPEIMGDIERDNLLHPALTYDIVAVKSLSHGVIELEEGTRLHAPLLSHRLAHASELAFGVVTIGNSIAETIDQLFKTGKQLKAVLMEEIANACLYKVSMQFQQRVDERVTKIDLQASGTLAPGDDGFDLGEQERVLALAGAAAINVTLTESFMMKPRHSVSNVIGIGRRMQKWTQIENCSVCAARDRCPHRQTVEALTP
jgi:hypothetical protein